MSFRLSFTQQTCRILKRQYIKFAALFIFAHSQLIRHMKYILLLSFVVLSVSLQAQNCNCIQGLDSLKNFIEKNYAGAKDKLTPATKKAYTEHTARCLKLARLAKNDGHCLYIYDRWLKFFKDHHIQLNFSFSAEQLKQQAEATEQQTLTPHQLNQSSSALPFAVEGVYFTADTTYKVAVVKSKNGFRDYAGIILSTKATEWNIHQVKFELIETAPKEYDVIWYNRAHHPSFGHLSFTNKENEFIKNGWFKMNMPVRDVEVYKPPFEEENKLVVFFKQLDAETGYLRIQSFDGDYAKQIDSVVNANRQSLESSPYLVIDVRGNGGGSDFSYRPLAPLIYTQPVHGIGVDVLATEHNMQAWEQIIKEVDMPEDTRTHFLTKVEEAKKHLNTFYSMGPDEFDTLKAVLPNPQKVAIIINGRCGSTTEQFLLEARQSKKVTIMGTHTLGVLDYGNMRLKKFSCPKYDLYYATTRSRRIDIGQAIDNIGIQPTIALNFMDSEWLQQVKDYLRK